jgi:hypothetical protein
MLTINFYSELYYNSEVWLMKSLHHTLKLSLLVASSNACKLALHYPRYILSFNDLHVITNRATLSMFCEYKLALQLFKLFNHSTPVPEWTYVNFYQQITTRQVYFNANRNNRLILGMNALCNRFFHLYKKYH